MRSSYKAFILTIFLAKASNYLIFDRLYFAAFKMFQQFFFEFTWNWFSALTGYNDEHFFHACASLGLSPGFKLNGNS